MEIGSLVVFNVGLSDLFFRVSACRRTYTNEFNFHNVFFMEGIVLTF